MAIRKIKDLGLHYLDRPIGLLLVIAYKLAYGTLEIISGVLILFSYRLLANELLEDPQDLLANWLLNNVHITQRDTVYLGLLFLSFGLIKIVLAICLWFRLPWIRGLGLGFFGMVGAFGLAHLAFHYSPITLVALVFDLAALGYFWKILPTHLSRKKMVYE